MRKLLLGALLMPLVTAQSWIDLPDGVFQMVAKAVDGTDISGVVSVKKDTQCRFTIQRAPQATGHTSTDVGQLAPSTSGCSNTAAQSHASVQINLDLTFQSGVRYSCIRSVNGSLAFDLHKGTDVLPASLMNIAPTGSYLGDPALGGDPVLLSSGELFGEAAPDLSLGGGPLPLEFRRYYRSMLGYSGVTGTLGTNWRHNFEVRAFAGTVVVTIATFHGDLIRFVPDGSNWVMASSHPLGYQLSSVAGGGFRFLDPADNLIYTFNTAGLLTRIEDRNGNALTVTQGSAGPTSISDGIGRTLSLTYNSSGQLTKAQDQTGRSVSFAFTGTNLASATDALGRVTSYSTATAGCCAGLITKTTLPGGNTSFAQTYDGSGRVSGQSDGLGNLTAIGYSTSTVGDAAVRDALGNITSVSHADLVNYAASTDPLGNKTVTEYDASHRPISTVDRNGKTSRATYHDPSGYIASMTDAAGNTSRFSYTASSAGTFTFYDRTSISYPDGAVETFAYDAKGNLTKSSDRAGNATTFTYNSRGQVLTTTNPVGGITTFTYNTDGTVASLKTAAGDTTTFTYDALKRANQIKFPDGSTELFTYDALDRITQRTDPRSKTTSVTFTENGDLKNLTDPLNNTVSLAYDAADNPTSLTTPLGTTKVAYDAVNLASAITFPTGETATLSYDKLNRDSTTRDSSGQVTALTYDNESGVTSFSDGANRTFRFTPDALGWPIQFTTPLGATFKQTFDAMGRISSIQEPTGGIRSVNYDVRGFVSAISLPGTVNSAYSYDALGDLIGIKDPNGNSWTRNFDNLGRMTARQDPLGKSITFTYNSQDRITSSGSPEGTVQFTYDPAGNLLRRLYSDKTEMNYVYDGNDRVTSSNGVTFAYDASGNLTNSNGLAIERDASNRIKSIAYPPGKVVYAYNGRGRLESITDWTGAKTTFAYEGSLKIASITRANGVITTYSYDGDGRVSESTETRNGVVLSSIRLQRDALGLITGEDRTVPQSPSPAPGTQSATYNAAHQIVGAGYDGLGRLTNDKLSTYVWDLATRLTSYQGAAGSASFTYDAFGMRLSRTGSGVTETYAWNYALELPSVAIVSSGGKDQRYYVYTPDGTLTHAIDAATNVHHYYHFDEAGNTLLLTDEGGTVTDSYGITPFGESVTHTGSTPNPFTWQGKFGAMSEGSTGLFYMRARFYDAATARFLSRDPMDSIEPNQIDPYQYALNQPVSTNDPTGLSPIIAKSNFQLEPLWWLNPSETAPAPNTCLWYGDYAGRLLAKIFWFAMFDYDLGLHWYEKKGIDEEIEKAEKALRDCDFKAIGRALFMLELMRGAVEANAWHDPYDHRFKQFTPTPKPRFDLTAALQWKSSAHLNQPFPVSADPWFIPKKASPLGSKKSLDLLSIKPEN